MHEDEHPAGFADVVPRQDAVVDDDLVVARTVCHDRRPYARLETPPDVPVPAVRSDQGCPLPLQRERWCGTGGAGSSATRGSGPSAARRRTASRTRRPEPASAARLRGAD